MHQQAGNQNVQLDAVRTDAFHFHVERFHPSWFSGAAVNKQ